MLCCVHEQPTKKGNRLDMTEKMLIYVNHQNKQIIIWRKFIIIFRIFWELEGILCHFRIFVGFGGIHHHFQHFMAAFEETIAFI